LISSAFKAIEELNSDFDNKIIEISVKQSQMTFTFEDETIISDVDVMRIFNLHPAIPRADITCFNNRLYVSIRDLYEKLMRSETMEENLRALYEIIIVLRDNLCQCPALEYAISEEYIKIYLDVPNIQLSNLNKVNDILKQDPFVEFTFDRPYLLYINEGDAL